VDPQVLKVAADFLHTKERDDGLRFASPNARYEALALLYRNAFYARELERQPFYDALAEAYNEGRTHLRERWPALVRSE
jgi:hypothetical protein